MKVTCQSCGARYGIADAKIRGRRAKVRCKSCKAVFVVDGTALDPDAEPMRESMAPSMSLPPPEPDEGVYDAPSGPELASEPMAAEEHPAGEYPPPSDVAATEAPVADPTLWSVSVSDDDERTLTAEELVAGLAAGELGADPYIWRDGMGDWAPPAQVPEIAALLGDSMVSAAPVPVGTDTDPSEPFASAPPGDAAAATGDGPTPPPFAAPSEDAAETNANYVPVAEANPTPAPFHTNADYAPVAPALDDSSPERAAELAAAPMFPASVDLFAGVDRAGSEEDVIASVPPPPPAIPMTKTGERNETSVLFTLDALRAGAAATPPPATAGPPPRLTDLVGVPSGNFGDEADLATLAAPLAEEIITSTGVGGQPPPAKSKKGVFIAAAAAVLVVAGIGIAMTSGGDDDKDSGANAVNAPAKTDEALAKTDDAPKTDEPKADEPKQAEGTAKADDFQPASGQEEPGDGEAGPTPGDPAATGAGVDTATPTDKPAPKVTDDKPKPRVRKPKPRVRTPTPKPKVVKDEGNSLTGQKPPFNMAAAKQALSSAAKRARGCQRSGGPTGKIKVSVTFSNSGRTTSSKIVSGPVRGTLVGGCVATAFRKTKVPAFSGPRKTIPVSFRLK